MVRADVIKLQSITQTDRGNSPEIVTEKLENVVNCLRKNLNAPRPSVDRLEQSSSPPERNIKWPKTDGS